MGLLTYMFISAFASAARVSLPPRRVVSLGTWLVAAFGWLMAVSPASAAYSTSQQGEITANVPVASANFGTAVAISGDVALVGEPKAMVGGNVNQGAAYIYTRSGGVWTFQAKLTASDGAAAGAFGTTVALQSGTAIIGATGGNAVYVFTGSGSSWTQQAKLISGDASTNFGQAVALDSGTALIGASNAAYVFTGAGAVWTQQTKLTAAGLGFGASVALAADTALVGAPNATGQFNTGNAGLAYGFLRTGVTWSAASTISEGVAVEVNHRFGTCVALSGNTAFISNNAGVTYALTRANSSTASFPAPNFNDVVVTLSGTRAAADANTAVSASAGVLSIYKLVSGSWALQVASSANSAGGFGSAIAVSGDSVLLGAPTNTASSLAGAGSAFIYTFADNGSLPTIDTPTSTSLATTSATLGGNVTSDGGQAITAVGVVVSPTGTNSNPTVGGNAVLNFTAANATGVFTVSATGLTAGTGYSYAGYVTTAAGTAYTSVSTFTTIAAASTNANLSALTLSVGTLSPVFAGTTTSYTASVSNGVTGITVTPTAADGTATITVNGNAVASGAASGTISLSLGANTVTTVVTAQDTTTTKTYTVTVTRLPAVPVISSSLAASGTYGSAISTYTIAGSSSPASYNATGLPPGLSVNTANGQITGTPSDATGSPYNVTISATNAGGTGSATLVFTVNKVGLTVSGFAVGNKIYDGAVAAGITGTPSLVGIVGSDNVTLNTAGASAAFATKTVGTGKTVTASGYALAGTAAANYSLTQPTTTAQSPPRL
jgi:hypothetical protein